MNKNLPEGLKILLAFTAQNLHSFLTHQPIYQKNSSQPKPAVFVSGNIYLPSVWQQFGNAFFVICFVDERFYRVYSCYFFGLKIILGGVGRNSTMMLSIVNVTTEKWLPHWCMVPVSWEKMRNWYRVKLESNMDVNVKFSFRLFFC